MTSLRIMLLGSPQIFRDSDLANHNLSQKALGLLAYLVMSPSRGYTREELSGIFWGETNDENANFNLRRTLWSLRKAINPPGSSTGIFICYKEGRYSFNHASDYWLDVPLLEQAAAPSFHLKARNVMSLSSELRPNDSSSHGVLREIVQLYRGDFLDGCKLDGGPVFEDWLFFERQRLKQCYIHCLRQLANASVAKYNYHQAIEDYQAILKVDPLDEPTHRDLMVAYYMVGMRDKAVEHYYHTQSMLLQQFNLEPLPETLVVFKAIRENTLTLEGKSYKLTSSTQPAASIIPSVTFIGRTQEKEILFDALKATNQRNGKFVVISGEAGVGKTRLVEEFLYRLSNSPYTILRARCYAQEHGLPFQPIIDAIRAFLLTVDINYIKKLSNLWLAEVAKLLPELHGYLPHLLISSTLFPEQERNRLFEGLAQFIAHLGQREPVILFLDDLDAADIPTLELIHFLARRLATARVLMIGTIRTEALTEHNSLNTLLQELNRSSRSVILSLERLTEAEVSELVNRSSGISKKVDDLGHYLYNETGGNPFFLIEMLKARQEWQGTPSESLIVPSNLRSIIEHRLKQLDDKSRGVVIMAAVIGRQFELSTLQKIYSDESHHLLYILDRLINQGWIEELPGGNPGTFDFNHGLVREAVYQTLSTAWRQSLHYQVGLAFESTASANNELAGVLAHHFGKSTATNKALNYALQAAEHARRLYAHQEAINHYLHVLKIAERISNALSETETLDIKCQLGQSYEFIGQYDTAIAIYQTALPSTDFPNASHRRVGFQLARAYDRIGQYDQALEILKTIGEQLLEPEDAVSRIDAAMNARGMASVYLHREQSHQSLAFCQHALAIIGDENVVYPTPSLTDQMAKERVAIYEIMANCYFHLGNYEESVNHYQAALQIAQQQDQSPVAARLLIGLGGVARRRGQYSDSTKFAEMSLKVCREIGHISGEAAANILQGDVAYNRGDFEQALSDYEQALSTYRQIGDQHGIADSCISLGFVKIDQDKIEAAENYLLEALAIGRTLDAALVLIRAQYHLARVALARGQLEQAQAGAEQALKAAQSAGIRLLEAAVNHQLGVILTQRQQLTQGELHIVEALNLYESMGDTFETAWVMRSLAQLFAIRGELSHALPQLQRALELFSDIGAERELSKTKELFKKLKNI